MFKRLKLEKRWYIDDTNTHIVQNTKQEIRNKHFEDVLKWWYIVGICKIGMNKDVVKMIGKRLQRQYRRHPLDCVLCGPDLGMLIQIIIKEDDITAMLPMLQNHGIMEPPVPNDLHGIFPHRVGILVFVTHNFQNIEANQITIVDVYSRDRPVWLRKREVQVK